MSIVSTCAAGTHSVCVCTYHQNVELMHKAVDLGKTVHELTDMTVCSRDNKNCMLHACDKCPGVEPLKQFLVDTLTAQYQDGLNGSEHSVDEDKSLMNKARITCSRWTSTDRSGLVQVVSSVSDFFETFCIKLFELKPHSFIAKEQNAYLNSLKENLKEDEAIAILDFAENFSLLCKMKLRDSTGTTNSVLCIQ